MGFACAFDPPLSVELVSVPRSDQTQKRWRRVIIAGSSTKHRTGIAEVTGSNPVEALIFFRLLLSNCLNWKIYCDDRSSLSSPTGIRI